MSNCFVLMPIGDQKIGDSELKAEDLKKKYDDLIREAILTVKPDIEVVRADEIAMPGSITNDIFARLMHSEYVIADISYPNPNVFYELGIRHAIRNKTILIKEKGVINNVFDISHLRYIEYENTSSGLKELAQKMKNTFDFINNHPNKPDNQFLEYAILTKYQFPQTIDKNAIITKRNESMKSLLNTFFSNPELMNIMFDKNISEEERNMKVLEAMVKNPDALPEIIGSLIDGGLLK